MTFQWIWRLNNGSIQMFQLQQGSQSRLYSKECPLCVLRKQDSLQAPHGDDNREGSLRMQIEATVKIPSAPDALFDSLHSEKESGIQSERTKMAFSRQGDDLICTISSSDATAFRASANWKQRARDFLPPQNRTPSGHRFADHHRRDRQQSPQGLED